MPTVTFLKSQFVHALHGDGDYIIILNLKIKVEAVFNTGCDVLFQHHEHGHSLYQSILHTQFLHTSSELMI